LSRLRVYNPVLRRDERERLLQIVASCLSDEPFRRADGQVVRNYVQGHLLLGQPEALRLASSLVLDVIRQTSASVVAGEVSAACALVSGILTLAGATERALTGRYIRKEPRPYGLPGLLTAPLPSPSDVFLVDDVSATGDSGARCIGVLHSLGHNPVAMMVVVDRDQGAAERLAQLGVDLWTLFRLEEVRSAGAKTWRRAASG
jgi:orotate phosphoribosyltransferase